MSKIENQTVKPSNWPNMAAVNPFNEKNSLVLKIVKIATWIISGPIAFVMDLIKKSVDGIRNWIHPAKVVVPVLPWYTRAKNAVVSAAHTTADKVSAFCHNHATALKRTGLAAAGLTAAAGVATGAYFTPWATVGETISGAYCKFPGWGCAKQGQ